MIDEELFLQQTALLADRVGRELAGPTQREYWRQLSAELTTEQYLAAMTLLIRTWDAKYRTWPSIQQVIETIRPVAKPTLSAFESFELVLAAMNDPRISVNERRQKVQLLGATTLRAFLAAGGNRDFADVLESDVVWLRRRFVEAYEAACQNADAEQMAAIALNDADSRVAALIGGLAESKAMPVPARRIAG